MPKKVLIGVKVVPFEKRDFFRSLPEEVQESWDPAPGIQVAVGENTQYSITLPDHMADEALTKLNREVANVRFAVEEREEHIQGEKEDHVILRGVAEQDGSLLPDPATLAYVGARDLSRTHGGLGTMLIGSDTGCSEAVKAHFGDRFFAGRNFTGEREEEDTSDGNGHGSGTGFMATPPSAHYTPFKVLKDSGSGGSAGIVKSFYAAGDLAAQYPDQPCVYNASWGSAVTNDYYQPYVEGIKYATDRGVVFVFSAGNENTYGLGSPSNICRINSRVLSSIAFDKTRDTRASFSNYHETGSISGPGVREIGYDETGATVYWSGTSFSAPWTSFCLLMLADMPMNAEQNNLALIAEALKKNGRDSSAPVEQEGGGVLDAQRAFLKLMPNAPTSLPEVWYMRRKSWESKEAILTDRKGKRLGHVKPL